MPLLPTILEQLCCHSQLYLRLVKHIPEKVQTYSLTCTGKCQLLKCVNHLNDHLINGWGRPVSLAQIGPGQYDDSVAPPISHSLTFLSCCKQNNFLSPDTHLKDSQCRGVPGLKMCSNSSKWRFFVANSQWFPTASSKCADGTQCRLLI